MLLRPECLLALSSSCLFYKRVFRFHLFMFFFFNDTATTEIYTLSLHDALPISARTPSRPLPPRSQPPRPAPAPQSCDTDRKSTRLNSSHSQISYAVFCLKKKKMHQHYRELHLRMIS